MDPCGNSETPGSLVLARRLVEALSRRSRTMVAAESCTAGLVADLVAQIPGASGVLWGSFVTYMVDAKIRVLGLDTAEIERFGPVSRETACAMALGALDRSGADYAVAVTGLAGPGGDGSGVPVGTVWIATAEREGAPLAHSVHLEGTRDGIRRRAAREALEALLKRIFLGENNGNEDPSPV